MTARIVDLRLVLDRDGRLRLTVDGRELERASSASEALRFVADRLAARPPSEQLSALATAIGPSALERCAGCGLPLVPMPGGAIGCPYCATAETRALGAEVRERDINPENVIEAP